MSKIHSVDGKKYVEVERDAEIGEKILTIRYNGGFCEPGDVLVCTNSHEYSDGSISAKFNVSDDDYAFFDTECDIYRVLEPIKPTLSELCAKCTPENRHEEIFVDERQASPEVIDMLANLARRVTQLESQLAATQRNLETFAGQTEDNSEDIRELDGRTQVLSAINKYYAEGSR
jgi:hypothetical protein